MAEDIKLRSSLFFRCDFVLFTPAIHNSSIKNAHSVWITRFLASLPQARFVNFMFNFTEVSISPPGSDSPVDIHFWISDDVIKMASGPHKEESIFISSLRP